MIDQVAAGVGGACRILLGFREHHGQLAGAQDADRVERRRLRMHGGSLRAFEPE